MNRQHRARKLAMARAHAARRDNRRAAGAELLGVQRKRVRQERKAARRAERQRDRTAASTNQEAKHA